MSRMEDAKEIAEMITKCVETAPPVAISSGVLDRFNVVIMANIMLSLATIADNVNKEEKDD